MTKVDGTVEQAQALDREDELAAFRERFYLLQNGIYMDGNSLGLCSRDAEQAVLNALQEWKTLGIDGWTEASPPWFYLAEELGKREAALVGGKPEEVIVAGSTTVNLHQLVSTFFHPQGTRTKILTDELNFPSDQYALQSQLLLKGLDPAEHLVLVKSRDGRVVEEEDIIAAMTDEIALIMLPAVLYRSGQLLDMERLTTEAHARGIVIGFDCCHSIGAVPHHFSQWGTDFAFWCNYKYLNAGPGSVGGLYVNERHFGTRPGLSGWFGYRKDRQFDMVHEFEPADSAGAWQIGTTHLLSTAPLLGSLKIFEEAGIDRIRAKSLRQTEYMMQLIDRLPVELGYSIGNPRDDARRGGHVSLEHAEAVRICKALKARHIIPDFRFPNVIRLAPIALYNTYEEIWRTVEALREIIENREYEAFATERGVVA
ncbi:kynureninase [Tumebacillus permanentifrigoris]|uniref:Kynureninase n=1 Tax=Tumebacillus permanentifrigoris TaxID=378543 RepID=A0A316DDH4_9BACL|nr:kynureninase [Tumebacillus permanentifrigoris]PWK15678.1 kynureninase [Tumebacillus permanentifrigoris]